MDNEDTMMTEHEEHLTGRVTALEVAVKNTQTSITSLASNVEKQIENLSHTVERQISSLTNNIQTLSERHERKTQTNWGNIAAWAGVLVVVAGLVIYQPLTELRLGFVQHISDGHPTSVIQKTITNDKSIKNLTERFHKIVLPWMIKNKEQEARFEERLLQLERDIYSGSSFRSGRPIRPPLYQTHEE